MRKFCFFLLVIFSMNACRDETSKNVGAQDSGWAVELSNLPKPAVINAKAASILSEWVEYRGFETSFNSMYRAEFREDFILTIEDLVEKQKTWEASVYPSTFDIPQVKGRQKVLKTFILQTKADLEYRQNPEESIKEMVGAFNALRKQFNVTVNNILPEDLLSDEN
ncbi:hypothetical protein [Maribacter sp. 2304DJ31-5]|uniref:hypothetical protein n=1 Tax=Maribacter sp. 2304DJ31-5 TaxID=3386273 RepID=UPI0039BD86D9